ncbi:MAG TPA: neutral trehalase [Clostridiales bacterium]|nr:neutral trehalase [Clostridiales bacterium]
MKKDFRTKKWKDYVPVPVFDERPEFTEFYKKAWEIARAHVKEVKGMPQTPYMDEAFCDTQIWIWDSCFMSLFCKFAQEVFPGVETLENFYEALYGGKSLGEVIPTENEPAWTGAVAGKPKRVDIHIADNPPLFAWAEYENALYSGDVERLKKLLYEKKFLQKHYEWMENLRENTKINGVLCETCLKKTELGYKWEGGRSGMDNTPRGRKGEKANEDRPNDPDMLWIDAICQQALTAKKLSETFLILNDKENAEVWEKNYEEKKRIVNDNYWDEKDKFYYDIDCKDGHFIKVPSMASFWTMTAGIATKERAKALAGYLTDPEMFGGNVPFTTVARKDADFVPEGQYWRGSVWLPTAYAALKGLADYGYVEEARETGKALIEHMYRTYTEYEPHTIWECYSPTEYKPATQTDNVTIVRPNFCGWSALGPIAVYIEYVLGFYKVNAFENSVKWAKPDVKGKVGVKNFRFGDVVTDIIADGNKCFVVSNGEYALEINGKEYKIEKGENEFIV